MAQECGFFNAELEGSEYDRVYNAEQFAAYFASFIGNGVFGNSMGELVVLENQQANMSVDVSSGKGWINGWWYRNTEELNLPIALADGVLNRKDIVVLRWGNSERDMWLQVLQGEPSGEPIAPEIVRNADYYDLKLCEIDIPAGTTRITQSLITDTRLDNNVCGLVTGLIDQIDTTELYLQFNAQFNAWFSAIQEQFEGDVPAILQAQIDDLFGIISSRIESSSTSTHAYSVGDLFIYDNKLCKASSAISIGDTIILSPTTNYNCEQTSIVDEIPLGGGGTPGVFYNTDADAEADIVNIPEGSMVYTNDGEDEPINARQIRYDDGTQQGSDVETQINNIKNDLIELAEEVSKMGMPNLDYSNPLHTFTTGNLTYTATKDCYLVGTSYGNASRTISVNGTKIVDTSIGGVTFINTKLTTGDVVTTSVQQTSLHVLQPLS